MSTSAGLSRRRSAAARRRRRGAAAQLPTRATSERQPSLEPEVVEQQTDSPSSAYGVSCRAGAERSLRPHLKGGLAPKTWFPRSRGAFGAHGIRRFGATDRRQCRRSAGRLLTKRKHLVAFRTLHPAESCPHRAAGSLRPGMELAGRKALLTGATGGLGRAIAAASPTRGAQPRCSAAATARRWRRWPPSCPAPATASSPPTSPSPAPPSGSPPRPPAAGRRPRRQRRPARRRLARRVQPPRRSSAPCGSTSRRRCCSPARSIPAMVERGSGHLVFVSSLSGKAASPRTSIYNATKFGLRGFALGLRTDLGAARRRRLARLPGLHPRRRHVRRRRRQDAAGDRHRDPRAGRRRGRQGDRARTRSRSPSRRCSQRVARPLRAGQPGDLGPRRRAAPLGQKAAEEVAAGHRSDKR